MLATGGDLVRTLRLVYPTGSPPKPLNLLLAVERVRNGQDAGAVAKACGTTRARLETLVRGSDPALVLLKGSIPQLEAESEGRVRRNLGQLLLGAVAEEAFEELYRQTVGSSELKLEDDRSSRTDTDYRVLNGQGRPVFRMNIKFFGSPFRKAKELVGLDPEDCFALATYKIHHALEKQQAEHLAYVFAIVGVPALTGSVAGQAIPDDLVHLSAIVHKTSITQKRAVEDDIVQALVRRPDQFAFERALTGYRESIHRANWYVLSARRAFSLLRETLFERAYALRVRAFARNYKNAELDMHFSLRNDLTPLSEFLRVLRDDGLHGLVARLERGTI